MQVQSLGQEDPLVEEMATHSSILAWEIPWTEENGGLQSMVAKSWAWLGTYTQFKAETQTYLYSSVHHSIIHSSQNIETIQMTTDGWIDKPNVVHKTKWYSNLKRDGAFTHYNMEKHWTKLERPDTNVQKQHDSTHIMYLEQSNSQKQKVEW